MDANIIEEVATNSGASEFSLVDSNWPTSANNCLNSENSTLLYIAVAPVQFNDFDSHVSPLDPNMSSVARYSPVYNDSTTEFNPVIIHQLISQSEDVNSDNPQFNLDANLTPSNQLLQMVESAPNNLNSESFQLISNPNDQEVELFITDQATGISYSVTQELLVGRLGEEQLLEALAPDQLLDSELLTLDEPLKSEADLVIDSNVTQAISQQVTNFINNMGESDFDKGLQGFKADFEEKVKGDESNSEQNMVPTVYTVEHLPTHARSSLPDDFLTIEQVEPGCFGVFAKSTIPMGMQMGPLEGIMKIYDKKSSINEDDNSLKFLLNFNSQLYRLMVDNEDTSNWMRFIRKANTYKEQNLVISQQNTSLYFTTIKIIEPKQELKVGYSKYYGITHNLPTLEPISHPCSECSATFSSIDDLSSHFGKEHEPIVASKAEIDDNDLKENEDDPKITQNPSPINNNNNCDSKKTNFTISDTMQCKLCQETFPPSCNNDFKLREHLEMAHKISRENTNEDFFILTKCFTCFYCNVSFGSEALMQIHVLEHVDSDVDDQICNKICPNCQRKFPTSRQLVMHVLQHKLASSQKQLTENKPVKCQICYKSFNLRERLQRHMLAHGSDDIKPLECKTCGKRFLNKSALICHVKTHQTDKKHYECPMCKERFGNVLLLRAHVPLHIKNNCFTCPVCKKVFKKYAIIRKHIRSFHGGKKHSCQYCPKLFPTIDKLRMHLLRHSDHKEFLCSDCGKQFKRKDKLKEHCKRMHSEERENKKPKKKLPPVNGNNKKLLNRSEPSDFDRFIYKCVTCMLGFKRRGMLVNHLAKRHPDIPPDSVPELNLPILQTTRDYYCQYCEKVYKSSSKRKAHILKNHPGAELPMSNRKQSALPEGVPNPTFSQPVGSITTRPQNCNWCHKQYASKAKLLQHQRKKHPEQMRQQKVQEKTEKEATPPARENVVLAPVAATIPSDVCLSSKSNFNIISIDENGSFAQQTTFDVNQDSQLYKLLTTATSNELLQPS